MLTFSEDFMEPHIVFNVQEEFSDTKGVIRIRKSKTDRQHNDKKKTDRQHNDKKKTDRQHNDQKDKQ